MKSDFEELVELRELLQEVFEDCKLMGEIARAMVTKNTKSVADILTTDEFGFLVDFAIKYTKDDEGWIK